jgi:hypothetical protein
MLQFTLQWTASQCSTSTAHRTLAAPMLPSLDRGQMASCNLQACRRLRRWAPRWGGQREPGQAAAQQRGRSMYLCAILHPTRAVLCKLHAARKWSAWCYIFISGQLCQAKDTSPVDSIAAVLDIAYRAHRAVPSDADSHACSICGADALAVNPSRGTWHGLCNLHASCRSRRSTH